MPVTVLESSVISPFAQEPSIDTAIFNLDALTLDLDDEESVFPGRAEFDYGEIDDKRYGKARIKGVVGLCLPKGEYVVPDPANEDKAVKYLMKWADDHNFNFTEEKFRIGLAFVGTLGHGDLNRPLRLALSVTALIPLILDDLETSSKVFTRRGGAMEQSNGMFQTYMDILDGKYPEFNDLPRVDLPMLQPFITLSYMVYDLIRIGLKEGDHHMSSVPSAVRQEILNSMKSFLVCADSKFVYKCTERTYFKLRIFDATFLPFIEWLTAEHDLKLDDGIRGNPVFQRMREAYTMSCGLSNDIIGIKKELKEREPTNLVLRKVIQLGITLEDATAQVVALLNGELNDMQVCAAKLMEMYPDHTDLHAYIGIAKYCCDGVLHLIDSSIKYRYGNMDDMVVKIIY